MAQTQTLADVKAMARPNDRNRSDKIGAALAKVEKARRELLPVESAVKANLDAEYARLTAEKEALRVADYPILDLDPLKWRDEEGLPRFALFSIQNATFRVEADSLNNEDDRFIPEMPEELTACYTDVANRIRALPRSLLIFFWAAGVLMSASVVTAFATWNFTWLFGLIGGLILGLAISMMCPWTLSENRVRFIEATYQGVIPREVKAKIAEARSIFGSEVYILSEMTKWKMGTESRPAADPLVLGYKGGKLFLIAAYDTTPYEEFVQREFAV